MHLKSGRLNYGQWNISLAIELAVSVKQDNGILEPCTPNLAPNPDLPFHMCFYSRSMSYHLRFEKPPIHTQYNCQYY